MPVQPLLAFPRQMFGRAGAVMLLALVVAGCAGVSPRPAPPPARPIIAAPGAGAPAARPAALSEAPIPEAPTTIAAPESAPLAELTLPAPSAAPRAASDTIVLILPLETRSFARAADAVRAGFLAAATAAGDEKNCVVIGHNEDGVLAAFEDARTRNAQVIVGPLVRDDVRAISQLALDLPLTIALNQVDEGTPDAAQLYSFPLAVESDARLIARRMRADNAQQVAVVSSESALMKRFGTAFAAEWMSLGGGVPNVYPFDGSADALATMRRGLGRRTTAAVLVALDSTNATLAKPYLGSAQAFASGLVFERETIAVTRDLDDLMLVEIPWLVTPDAPQFANLPKHDYPSSALQRLYALGLDAYRVARAFRNGPPARFVLDGATGQVTLEGHQLARQGTLAVYRAGQLQPLDAR